MQEAGNPYAPPKASLDPPSAESIWRDGKTLVLRAGAELPPRCVKCNAPAAGRLKQRTVYWHQPWVYVLVLLNVLIYLVVALILRKRAKVAPGLCARHRRHRWLGFAAGWGGTLLSLVTLVAGLSADSGPLLAVSGALLLVALVTGILLTRIVYPERIDREFVRLKGCGSAFLETLPTFRG